MDNTIDIQKVLDNHKKWICNKECGIRAYLMGSDLSNADLRGVDLRDANLRDVDLRDADLRDANLRDVDLRDADLSDADLRDVDLRDADLYNANLYCAKHINDVIWHSNTLFFPMQCPERGAYIGFKKAHGLIIELEIPADALRSSATTRKCRASKARVISITDVDGNPAGDSVASNYDRNFVYRIGEMVEVSDFDTDRWNECAPGIHHFITREEAVIYV